MDENEVIIVDGIPDEEYDSLIESCIRYALISKPFTIRRIGHQTLEQAILNIFKGKIAESLFQSFCIANGIVLDWHTCATPFWQVDKRDFIFNHKEWDIKNNFLYHPDDVMQYHRYTDLPCLIPNRFPIIDDKPGDQWHSRNYIKNQERGLTGVSYLFSFLKSSDLLAGEKRGNEFYRFNITRQQISFIDTLEKHYKGMPADRDPFTEQWFWHEMTERGPLDFIHLNFRPFLVITGYAGQEHWRLFRDTGPSDKNNNWQTYLKQGWYARTPKGSCNFMDGTLWTTITNATLPVSNLNSFLSLFPRLRSGILYGRLKQ